MKKRARVTKLLLLLFQLGIIFVVLLGGYIAWVSHEISETFRHAKRPAHPYLNSKHHFELGAFVSGEKLEQFYPLTKTFHDRDGEVFFRDHLGETGWQASTKIHQVLTPFTLEGLLPNHCEEIYCLQLRVPFDRISPSLWRGLIGIEDQRFTEHAGVDLRSIARAIIADIKAMSFVQGGSTLTQQLVKNLFFSNEKALSRKLKEVIYSLIIEYRYDKEAILNTYLNEVFWGTLGGVNLKGFYMASLFYFQKKADQLEDFESSILVAMLKGPSYYSPLRHLERLKKRSHMVYRKLSELGLFVHSDRQEWDEKKWQTWANRLKQVNNAQTLRLLWRLYDQKSARPSILSPYDEFVFNSLANHHLDRIEKRTIKGRKEELTQDLDLAVKLSVRPFGCEFPCEKEWRYYSKAERNKEEAFERERHQVGSILKPLSYQFFLENGKQWHDLVSTAPITLDLKSGPWTPRESSRFVPEEVTLLRALQKSRNRPLIRLASEVGLDRMEKHFLGFIPELKTPLKEFPAQLLGSIELSVSQVGRVYQKFVGEQCRRTRSGELQWKDSVLYQLSNATETTLENAIHPYFAHVSFFGKTGTSNNGFDSWFIGLEGKHLYVLWLGQEGRRDQQAPGVRSSGASGPFQIFQHFLMERGKLIPPLSCTALNRAGPAQAFNAVAN